MALTPQDISRAIQDGVVANPQCREWVSAANALIELLVSRGLCFSSGEIAAYIRTYQPDIRFSVTNLGEHIRDRFYANTMPLYNNPVDGTTTPVTQVPRVTQGLTRTPSGTGVFVYAPSYQAGENHPFEVDIPEPGATLGASGPLPPVPVQDNTRTPTPTPYTVPSSLRANVRTDGRVNVPRSVLESFLHSLRAGLVGGGNLWVGLNNHEARIYLNPGTGRVPYQVWASTGRIAFNPGAHLKVGADCPVRVDTSDECLVVDLTPAL